MFKVQLLSSNTLTDVASYFWISNTNLHVDTDTDLFKISYSYKL